MLPPLAFGYFSSVLERNADHLSMLLSSIDSGCRSRLRRVQPRSMDIDPLQETTTPRYAVESDDSDAETVPAHKVSVVTLEYTGAPPTIATVVIADIGAEWLDSVTNLGPAKGRITVDAIEVRFSIYDSFPRLTRSLKIGQLYEPTTGHAVISITHSLPASVSHEVSRKLVAQFPVE